MPSSVDITSVGVICGQICQIQEDGSKDLQCPSDYIVYYIMLRYINLIILYYVI